MDYARMREIGEELARYVVDPRKGTVAALSDPGRGPDGPRYRTRSDYLFGDPVTVGAWTVDTTRFRTYPPSR